MTTDTLSALSQQHCEACHKDAPKLTPEAISARQHQLPDWQLINHEGVDQLQRIFYFDNFQHALDFTCSIGALAEAEGHHPALLTEWGQVTVTWWSHKIKGLHHNDFIMAAQTDQAAQQATGLRH
ncbi:4a-hydroxytetrahydrobiopterin dehydratase [Terasakiispira papahanaumokuakeensis]|uniref:Putative pterin-4-alpha-carbinolamine dehydratase n=1 Tax=Terasakiispira papahanaumokuakeensis TaxID=197479 RepID=A0A1E2V9P1_9GAMM|nr:4a-hydroxytetrahydrobiopterin dehydratase [Terasakiispira papahanaumokuakeensis]ODC03728.1 4a-hydroxytetrahydrobiopterin dehydratase [Terasakiispira papahanaumokuakeensis]